jgi:hypothetical protein
MGYLRNLPKETNMNLKWLISFTIAASLWAGQSATPTTPQPYVTLQQIPVEKDVKAARLAEALKQAKTGNADSMAQLGVMLLLGSEVEKNLPEARQWLLRAAQKGQMEAQAKLGAMLFLGLGGPVDLLQSVQWFSAAAEQGEAYSMGCLGVMYATGTGVVQSAPDAFFWLCLAQTGGDTDITDQMLNDEASKLTAEQKEQVLQRLLNFIKKLQQLHI